MTTEAPALERCSGTCAWRESSNHSVVLAIETNPASLAALVHAVATWEDCEPGGDWPAPCDLPDLFAEHNWSDPTAMRVLAEDLYHLGQVKSEARRARLVAL